MDAPFAAELDDIVLGQRRVRLDLVDGGHDGARVEELPQVAGAVLLWSLGMSVPSARLLRRYGVHTLQTPIPFTLPVFSRPSIAFHVSRWSWSQTMSRFPLGRVGNRSWLPGLFRQNPE